MFFLGILVVLGKRDINAIPHRHRDEAHLLVRTPLPSDPKPQLLHLGRNNGHFDCSYHSIGVMHEHRTRVVITTGIFASLGAKKGGDFLRQTE